VQMHGESVVGDFDHQRDDAAGRGNVHGEGDLVI
jgi:hypothetical protein